MNSSQATMERLDDFEEFLVFAAGDDLGGE